MARYLGPKVKLTRKVGVPIVDIPKHTTKCKPSLPGMHGYRGRRLRDYGLRLNEKQKLRYHYNIMEKQFRRYLVLARRMKGNAGELMLQLLECRLDNVVRRAGLARTIWASRQMIVHGHIVVNGHKVDRPSFRLKVGDVITVAPRIHKLVRENMESLAGLQAPGWIALNPAELTIDVVAEPTSDQIPFDVDMNLIVEFYR